MAEKKEVFLTAAGFIEIESELDELKKVKRPAIINAIKSMLNIDIKIYASGRTDRYVHAIGQVFHFDIEKNIPVSGIKRGLNSYLPDDIYRETASEEVVITVAVEKLVSREITLTADDINILQKTSNKDYQLEVSDDFAVVVTGLDSDVDAITVEKLNPKIFSKDMSLGTHNDVAIDITQVDGITYEIKGTAKLTISAK